MADLDRYDVLVLGSGEGGKYLAWSLAREGRRVAVIERRLIGGSCPNTNCLPSKNEIWSAKVAHLVAHGTDFGVTVENARVDMRGVLARKRAMVDDLIALHLDLYRSSGAELIMGSGTLVARDTISVCLNEGGTRALSAGTIILNVGTHATIPHIPGLRKAEPLTNIEMLELDRPPEHLIVLGGGYVGLELAQAFRRFGSRVTVLEAGPRLASREDPDISAELLDLMQTEGVEVILGTTLRGVSGRSGEGIECRIAVASGERTIAGSDVLVAAGRTPITDGIGLEQVGVARDAYGYVAVNDRLETSVPGIWALGECAGSPQFTHVSFADYRVVHANLTGGTASTRNRLVPYCMYTDPPLARVGLSETEAIHAGIAVRVATLPVLSVLRSRTISETRGFMKVLVEANGDGSSASP